MRIHETKIISRNYSREEISRDLATSREIFVKIVFFNLKTYFYDFILSIRKKCYLEYRYLRLKHRTLLRSLLRVYFTRENNCKNQSIRNLSDYIGAKIF